MLGKKFAHRSVLLLFFLLVAFIAGCDNQYPEVETSEPRQTVNGQKKAEIDVNHIQVHNRVEIIFSGETTVSEGECILSQLFEDGTPVGWWPSDQCFLLTGRDWQFAVKLGEENAPVELDDSAQYRLQVWWAEAPEETVDDIYFDLAGPPSPPSP